MIGYFKGDTIETKKTRSPRTPKSMPTVSEPTNLGSSWNDVVMDTPTPTKSPAQGLKFDTQTNHLHHLYKCEVAKFKSNKAIDGSQPDWQDNEHVHWFHTISSDGKVQTRTTSVGGHYHKVEVIPQGEGKAPIVKCVSGPMKEAIKMEYGRRKKIEVPINDIDHHTHDITYTKSNVIIERQRNIEAAKVEAQIQAKFSQTAPSGISEGD